MSWTVEQVKEKLPDVKINVNGQIFDAKIYGRKRPFAYVTWGIGEEVEFSWQTICNCLNNGRILRA